MMRRTALPWHGAAIAALSAVLGACAGSVPRVYRGQIPGEPPITIAALPLLNLTSQPEAARVVLDQVIVELLRRPDLSVVPPAAVEEALTEIRIRDPSVLTLEQTRALGERLSAALLLMGTVTDYRLEADASRPLPLVSIQLRAVDPRGGQVVWAAAHTRTGSDTESVFGIGRVTSLPDLASRTVREMVATLPQGGQQ